MLGRILLAALLIVGIGTVRRNSAWAQSDPLRSWYDSAVKKAIINFVAQVTTQGSPGFVPVEQRIATFDNDGTLWAEQPMYFQLAFALDRVEALAPQHPEWKTTQPFKAVLEHDMTALNAAGEKGVLEIVDGDAQRHDDRRIHQIVTGLDRYRPSPALQASLQRAYLSADGGTARLPARQWVQDLYRVGRWHRVHAALGGEGLWHTARAGDRLVGCYQITDGGRWRTRTDEGARVEFVNDGPGKPVGINRFIGRRPIFAFGNSDGDLQMLQWTAAGSGARFMGLVHHTDAEREYAYDRKSVFGRLDKALDEANAKGWSVVDMKADWRTIFPEPH